jgi:hypothetical protein
MHVVPTFKETQQMHIEVAPALRRLQRRSTASSCWRSTYAELSTSLPFCVLSIPERPP